MSDDVRGMPEGVPDTPGSDPLERAAALNDLMTENSDLRNEVTDLRAFQTRQLRRNRIVNVVIGLLALVAAAAVTFAAVATVLLFDVRNLGSTNAAARNRADCIRDYTNDAHQLTLEFERGVNLGSIVTQAQRDSFERRALIVQRNLEAIDRGTLCPSV